MNCEQFPMPLFSADLDGGRYHMKEMYVRKTIFQESRRLQGQLVHGVPREELPALGV